MFLEECLVPMVYSTDGRFSAFRVSGRLSGQVGLFLFNWRYQDDAHRTYLGIFMVSQLELVRDHADGKS
jgi:hypothetical protein